MRNSRRDQTPPRHGAGHHPRVSHSPSGAARHVRAVPGLVVTAPDGAPLSHQASSSWKGGATRAGPAGQACAQPSRRRARRGLSGRSPPASEPSRWRTIPLHGRRARARACRSRGSGGPRAPPPTGTPSHPVRTGSPLSLIHLGDGEARRPVSTPNDFLTRRVADPAGRGTNRSTPPAHPHRRAAHGADDAVGVG